MKIHVSHDKADILEFLKPRPIQLSPPEFGIPVKHTHPDAARVENDRQALEIGFTEQGAVPRGLGSFAIKGGMKFQGARAPAMSRRRSLAGYCGAESP